ncbi:MAG: COR domain-containing protein, partial [Saprospiraceae bacterium]
LLKIDKPMSELALELIEKEKIERTGKLDLGYCGLTELPKELFELVWLEELSLCNRYYDYKQRKWIDSLNSGPSNILSGKLSEELIRLNKLHLLKINGDNAQPWKIDNIEVLKNLQNLNTLDLSYNNISNIEVLKNLQNLNTLYLSDNKIEDITALLYLIKKGIPVSLKQYDISRKINLYNNPITTPPLEIVKQGNEAIINYFKELEKGEVPLYECKLLIIGEGGAGKTSLARKLDNENNSLPAENESTKGIDILHYDFKMADENNFRINIWDFGGQEIYHATHQFFLTKRSMYILLDDTRKDDKTVNDTSFKYWLQVVELLSENSPVLIVQNEKSDRSKTLDLKSMQGRFDNILGSKATNLLTCRGLAEVKQAIEYQVQQLPHVGEMLPKQWVEIRKELEDLASSQDHISIEQYFKICSKHQISEEERALFLSSFLHDLGAFLHFKEDLILRNLFVLNNTWATDAVYKVLDDEKVKSNFGKFTFAELGDIWSDPRYRYKQPQLLALMEKFQLCFRLKDTVVPTYLAPQLLQVETPDFDWDYSKNLTLRFEYDFMPKGILSRFIVRMNRYVIDPDKAWRSGVFLHRQNADAFVQETYGSQEIVIRAKGTHAKELMTLIVEDFDLMHNNYGEKLKVKKWIPCICLQCADLETPNFYEFSNLRNRKEKGKRTIECDISFDDVNVNALLDGIFAQVIEEELETEKPIEVIETPTQASQVIELFLASSFELKIDRDEIEKFIRRQNDRLLNQNIYLKLNLWEDFLDAMSETRLQDEYNKAVLKVIFLLVYLERKWENIRKRNLILLIKILKKYKNHVLYILTLKRFQ